MRTNGVVEFAQRALWLYFGEAVLVMGLVLIIRAFT
jgi:hypothetical protein